MHFRIFPRPHEWISSGDFNDGGVIHIVNINADDVKDWNSYYQQFQ